ncbi:MAG: DUF309 domain-containing protein [Terracidiphilus sp.]
MNRQSHLDWTSDLLAEGLARYRAREFFEAHESWESAWLKLDEPEKSFLQALIQVTAAFHHLHRGNLVGARSLLRRSLCRLEQCPPVFGGLFLAPLLNEICAWLAALEADAPHPPSYPRISPLPPSD